MTRWYPSRAGRYLAEHIPGARYIELPGADHLIQTLDPETLDRLLDDIEEFVTGTRHRVEPDRMLATLLMNDIVGSTERAVAVGDRRWNDLLTGYYALVRNELATFHGHQVNTTGDGVLATFDGPARAIRCARSIRERANAQGIQLRSGLHTGECELIDDGIGGIAVHIAARVSAQAGRGRGARVEHRQGPRRRIAARLRRPWHPRPQGRPGRVATLTPSSSLAVSSTAQTAAASRSITSVWIRRCR